MKRYLVFAYDEFYPCGGWEDFIDAFGALADAKACGHIQITTNKTDWYEIVDLETLEVVFGEARERKPYFQHS